MQGGAATKKVVVTDEEVEVAGARCCWHRLVCVCSAQGRRVYMQSCQGLLLLLIYSVSNWFDSTTITSSPEKAAFDE